MNERAGLISIAMNGQALLKICIEYELVNDSIEAHAAVIAVNVAASENIGVYFVCQSAYMFFAPQL